VIIIGKLLSYETMLSEEERTFLATHSNLAKLIENMIKENQELRDINHKNKEHND